MGVPIRDMYVSQRSKILSLHTYRSLQSHLRELELPSPILVSYRDRYQLDFPTDSLFRAISGVLPTTVKTGSSDDTAAPEYKSLFEWIIDASHDPEGFRPMTEAKRDA